MVGCAVEMVHSHRDDKARCAKAALAAVVVDHGAPQKVCSVFTEVLKALMTACSLLILCSAPAIAGVRRAALANLLPTLVWIPVLTHWLRAG
jgi:uncharacterized membrane protein YqgA involved in biofilm formation